MSDFQPGLCMYCQCNLSKIFMKDSSNFLSTHENDCPFAEFCQFCGVRIDNSESIHAKGCHACENHIGFKISEKAKHTIHCKTWEILKIKYENMCKCCGTLNPFLHHDECTESSGNRVQMSLGVKDMLEEIIGEVNINEKITNTSISFYMCAVSRQIEKCPLFYVKIDSDKNNIVIQYLTPLKARKASRIFRNDNGFVETLRKWFQNEYIPECERWISLSPKNKMCDQKAEPNVVSGNIGPVVESTKILDPEGLSLEQFAEKIEKMIPKESKWKVDIVYSGDVTNLTVIHPLGFALFYYNETWNELGIGRVNLTIKKTHTTFTNDYSFNKQGSQKVRAYILKIVEEENFAEVLYQFDSLLKNAMVKKV